MKKNILITVRWPLGGIRTYLSYMFKCDLFKQYQITFLTPKLEEVKLLQHELCSDSISFIECDEGMVHYTKAVLHHITSGKYDLIHSQGLSSALVAALPAKLSKTPHVTTLHYSFSHFEYPTYKSKLKLKLFERILSLIECIQPVSYSASKNLQQYLPYLKNNKSKIKPILNGLDISVFKNCSETRDLRSELNIKNEIFMFGYMGRFMPPKGFKYIIQAVQQLNKSQETRNKFVVICAGSGDYIRETQKEISDLKLNHYFEFIPFTTEVVPLLRGFETILMPSLQEACSVLAMEALSAGTPTIGTSCIGLEELLKGSPAEIIPIADAHSLSLSMARFISDNRKAEFEKYKDQAHQRFDINHSAQALEEVYRQLLTSQK